MARGRRLLGQLVLVLAMMAAGFVGAKLGLLGTREVGASHNFNDVPPGAFYHDFVQFLLDKGITAGCGPDLFCGEQAVTRGQMAVFLKKTADTVTSPPSPTTQIITGNVVAQSTPTTVLVVPSQGTFFLTQACTHGQIELDGNSFGRVPVAGPSSGAVGCTTYAPGIPLPPGEILTCTRVQSVQAPCTVIGVLQ